MARLFADENFPLPAIELLRGVGHDVVTMAELGLAGLSITDADVLARATESCRAVVTLNRKHFVRLNSEFPEHSGIVVCSVDLDFAGLADRIHEQIEGLDTLAGRLIRVNRP